MLVGPNNSGKSAALREIREWTLGPDPVRQVVGELNADLPASTEDVLALLAPFHRDGPPPDQVQQEGHEYFHFPLLQESGIPNVSGNAAYQRNAIDTYVADPESYSEPLRSIVMSPLALRLDGPTRFALAADQPLGDLQEAPPNHLAALFRDDAARAELRDMVQRAFSRYPVLEAVGNGQVRLRLSDRAPENEEEERGLTDRSVKFHAAAAALEAQGDGIRAFVGLLAAVKSLPHRVLLVDEPEAFLHPPLARRLGRYLAGLISAREGSLLAATHSGDFLAGCVDAGQPMNVVRLTYDGPGTATARLLPADELRSLMTEPLVRSARVLSGLFHRAVVVVEGDTDRVFYDEINERLDDAGRGIGDALFINAHSWQTVGRIVEPLRRLGVPAAAVLDLDAIVKSGEWGPLWKSMNLTREEHQALNDLRGECETVLRATENGGKPYKTQGLDALTGADRSKVEQFLDELRHRGVFLVPVGSLESWLPELGVQGTSSWVERIFDAMGSDPAAEGYLKAGEGGPWAFIDSIEDWVADLSRAGIG